jgi:hypothetical protein
VTVASRVYANAKYLAATDSLGWANGVAVFRGLLVGASYSFNHVQTTVADILAHEVSGGSYARVDITGRTAILDLAGDRALCRANSPVFPLLSGVSPSGLIIYRQVGGSDATPANDPLICFIDFSTTPATGLNYLVEFSPDGVFALSQC